MRVQSDKLQERGAKLVDDDRLVLVLTRCTNTNRPTLTLPCMLHQAANVCQERVKDPLWHPNTLDEKLVRDVLNTVDIVDPMRAKGGLVLRHISCRHDLVQITKGDRYVGICYEEVSFFVIAVNGGHCRGGSGSCRVRSTLTCTLIKRDAV